MYGLLFGARSRQGERTCRPIDADDPSMGPDQFGAEECNITGATADVEHAHARSDAGFEEKLSSDWIDQSGLHSKPIKLLLGVAKHIGVPTFATRAAGFAHAFLEQSIKS